MASRYPVRLILGGTFDPVHVGHVHILSEVAKVISAQQAYFMPCGQSVEKSAGEVTSAEHRLAMLSIVAQRDASLSIETYELNQPGLSVTLQTLKVLEDRYQESLVFMMGQDVAQHLTSWDNWQDLRHHAHIIMLNRHHTPAQLPHAWKPFHINDPQRLQQARHGFVMNIHIRGISISATQIRSAVAQGNEHALKGLIDREVMDYIKTHNLYR